MKNDYLLDLAEVFGRNLGKAFIDHEEDGEIIVIENLSNKDMSMIILKRLLYSNKYTDGEDFLFTIAEENLNALKDNPPKEYNKDSKNHSTTLLFNTQKTSNGNITQLDREDLKELGQWFYEELRKKSEEDLNKNNFSSSEITKGLKDYMNLFFETKL